MEVLEESGLEPHIKSDPFLPQTCDILFSTLNDTNQAVIVLPQPSDFVELLSERLHVLDADSLELHLCDKISGFRSTDISPLDTKLFSDSGAESDDSGFHSFTDVSFFTERRSLIDEDDMIDNVLYTINANGGGDIDDEEGDDDDESDNQSDSSSGSSDDDTGSSSDEMDEESDGDNGKEIV